MMDKTPIFIVGPGVASGVLCALFSQRGLAVRWHALPEAPSFRGYLLKQAHVDILRNLFARHKISFDRILPSQPLKKELFVEGHRVVKVEDEDERSDRFVERDALLKVLKKVASLNGALVTEDIGLPNVDPQNSLLFYELSDDSLRLWPLAAEMYSTPKQKIFVRECWLPRGIFENGRRVLIERFPGCLAILEPHALEGHVLTLLATTRLALVRSWDQLCQPHQSEHSRLRALVLLNPGVRFQDYEVECGLSRYIVPGAFALGMGIGQLSPISHRADVMHINQALDLSLIVSQWDWSDYVARLKKTEAWHNRQVKGHENAETWTSLMLSMINGKAARWFLGSTLRWGPKNWRNYMGLST